MQKRTSCGMKSSPACKRRDHESTENYCILRLDDWISRNHRSVWRVSTGRDRNGRSRAGSYCHNCAEPCPEEINERSGQGVGTGMEFGEH